MIRKHIPATTPQNEAYRAYSRTEARGGHSADEISKLADLRDRGVITDEEFQKGKIQMLGQPRAKSPPGGRVTAG